jgi:MFS family permease
MQPPRKFNLWYNSDFLKLWISQTISQFGSQITILALPLTAALSLNATPFQMGILTASEQLPFLLFGLFAGVWVDRWWRRRILIITDIGRGLLLLVIPTTALFGLLRIEILWFSAFVVGILTMFFDVAYWSYLPAVVSRDLLVEGNSKLALSQSAAETVGPGFAGILVQLLTGPFTILVDAISFFTSALILSQIRAPELISSSNDRKQGVWHELISGLLLVFHDRILRALILRATVWNIFYNMGLPIFILFVTRDLRFRPEFIGVLFSAMGFGFLFGAMLIERITKRLGVGTTIIKSVFTAAIAVCLIPFTSGDGMMTSLILVMVLFIFGFMTALYNVNNISLRQAITPNHLLGRMTATMRFITWGIIPFAALFGGLLGEKIGLRTTLMVVGGGSVFFGILGTLFTPLRAVKEFPKVS